MQRTRVKMCGLTRVQDVQQACALGVDAIGFVCFSGSPRFVPPERLAGLAAAVAPLVTPVLLFVDAPAVAVERALTIVPHALLQFHGTEDAAWCQSFGRPYIRAVALAEGVDLLESEVRFRGAAGLLADTPARDAAAFGGSGLSFPWQRVPPPALRSLPLILAGGLRAENVGAAIGQVRPHAVDVSSGVESAHGIKSAERMQAFMAAVRAVDAAGGQVHGGAA